MMTKWQQKWLEFELTCKNNIFDPLSYSNPKGEEFSYKLTDLQAIIFQGWNALFLSHAPKVSKRENLLDIFIRH